MRSINGFVELQGIRAALESAAVFGESRTTALRVRLGDWRDAITCFAFGPQRSQSTI
jgi:hypothetical protein